MDYKDCEKKLDGGRQSKRETRRAEPERKHRADKSREQGSRPIAESGKMEKGASRLEKFAEHMITIFRSFTLFLFFPPHGKPLLCFLMKFFIVFTDACHQPWLRLAGMNEHVIDARVARDTFRYALADACPPAIGKVWFSDERATHCDEVNLAVVQNRLQPFDIPVPANQDDRDG